MINRILIRIKVLQIVYSFYQNGNKDLKGAETELLFSLQKSYDLYYYFLLLIVELTYQQKRNLEIRKNKYFPTFEELHPNTRLINNRFAAQIEKNSQLQKYITEQGISWSNDQDFIKNTLDTLLASELYTDYLKSPDTYESDKEFWKEAFKILICNNEAVDDYLEDKSIYWNDDIAIVESFVLKTIKKIEEKDGKETILLPMFKDMEDKQYAITLLRQTLLKGTDYRAHIEKHLKNWESERVANMDLLIMQVALAEILSFPSIPISVTLNEFIDISKYYSTPKSAIFINGILDSVIKELKSEKRLLKN
ncbi:transcription antitermination protein NusB [Parabacteroides pacaensis]|uniref:transcription antitermination protein NusB n=1 Tax=Parabacteroides pacaensis TaxID=2086575 RepID=UPI000D100A09|nr:transcription antitermination protein NusB [Parabacteroides pacaensis]